MPRCDSLIRGARIIDGSGGPSTLGDVAFEGDRIVEVGNCEHWRAEQSIDATGLALAPGFIDSHTHDDLAVLQNPSLECKVSQGVTSVIAGNCGISLAPLRLETSLPPPFPLLGSETDFQFAEVADYRRRWQQSPATINLALLAGHSSLRLSCLPRHLERSANHQEIDQMCAQLRLALRQGCIGMSTGLDYPPASAASTDEVLRLASVLAEFDGAVYATHLRDEGDEVVAAVRESLEICGRAPAPLVISHHKCAGPKNYGRSVETLALIDRAIEARQPVALDVYPYTASSTSLLPKFLRDAESVLVAESEPHPECNGRLLSRIAADWQCSPEQACERLYPAAAVYFQMADEDVERILSHPQTMIGSDGIASMQTPHPRLWGTFPRVLGHYVREKRLFDLETAVHKMTGLTARRFGLERRGAIKPGHFADLVLFDPDRIIDRADYEHPTRVCDGIVSVWVNGDLSWHQGASTRARSGRFLSHH